MEYHPGIPLHDLHLPEAVDDFLTWFDGAALLYPREERRCMRVSGWPANPRLIDAGMEYRDGIPCHATSAEGDLANGRLGPRAPLCNL